MKFYTEAQRILRFIWIYLGPIFPHIVYIIILCVRILSEKEKDVFL